MTSRYENIWFIAVISICSNLVCISTMSNELPSGLKIPGKYDASRALALKQHKFGTRILSPIDKLALLNRNEKMKAMDTTQNSEGDYRKNSPASNQNYLFQQPRILLPPPPPPPLSYFKKPFNQMVTKPIHSNSVYNDNNDNEDDDIDDDDDDNEYSDEIDSDEIDSDETSNDVLQHLEEEIKMDKEMALKSAGLLNLLLAIPSGPLPVIYIEQMDIPQIPYYGLVKRGGRYNQRYPWKRQNSVYRKESIHTDSRFHCIPSREEVFRLLIGLHENRSGNEPKMVRFCNRRRPARSILTSIRFMG